MKANQLRFLFIALLASTNTFAQPVFAQSADINESDFYKPTIGSARKILKDQPGKDDSDRLEGLIKEVADQGGGIVTIDSGTHYFKNVDMMSNVHIRVKSDATLKPVDFVPKAGKDYDKPNVNMFRFGDSENRVENVSFEGKSNTSRAKINLRTLKLDGAGQYISIGAQVISLKNVKNFRIANLDIQDKQTRLSAIGLGMVETNSGNKAPKDGVVQNISTINLHPGYGTVQAQSATHVLFQNLYAEGGTALRMESGVSDNFKNPVINNEIYGRNIRGKDCNVAVLISPHEVKQGKFDIRDVTGDGCAFAVKLAPGFPEGKRGTYRRNSILRDVKATFGTNAVIDKLNIKYLSCALKDQVVPVEDEVDVKDRMNIGPSVSAVLDVANYKIDFRDSDITQLDGFVEAEKAGTERVVTMEDVGNLKCPS